MPSTEDAQEGMKWAGSFCVISGQAKQHGLWPEILGISGVTLVDPLVWPSAFRLATRSQIWRTGRFHLVFSLEEMGWLFEDEWRLKRWTSPPEAMNDLPQHLLPRAGDRPSSHCCLLPLPPHRLQQQQLSLRQTWGAADTALEDKKLR